MTVQEAKMQIQAIPSKIWEQLSPCDNEAMGIAIEALEKIEKLETNKTYNLYRQYLSIGTVEELKEAREKQVAKKPIGKYTDYKCSVCGRRVRSGKGSSSRQRDNFCQRCGTKIDWGEEDD